MSVSIELVKATPTWTFWDEYTWKCQVYNTENIEWFEDYTNNKKYVRDNEWSYLEDDFYWKCKPKDFVKVKKYINKHFYWHYKDMHLKAIKEIENNSDVFYEFWW